MEAEKLVYIAAYKKGKKMHYRAIAKIALRTLAAAAAFVLLYGAAALLLPMIAIECEPSTNGEIEIFILSNGVHTDVVMPARHPLKDWTVELPYANTRGKDTSLGYIALGWGDKGFYLETPTWADLKVSTALKAVSGFNSTAIHATYHKKMTLGPKCRKMKISAEQYRRLIAFVDDTFERDSRKRYILIPTDAVYGTTDAFYEAHGRYSLFYTCNTWANQALKACGQRACLWTPFDTPIFEKYE